MADVSDTLRRKLAAQSPGPDQPEAGRPEALALARGAHERLALAVSAGPVRITRASATEILEGLGDGWLVYLLVGPGGASGLLALAPSLCAGLGEWATLGALGVGDPALRRPTRLDAALAAEFATLALDALAGLNGGRDFRLGSFVADLRPLALLLDDVAHSHMTMALRLGDRPGREGDLMIALPEPLSGGRSRIVAAAGGPKGEGPARPSATEDPAQPDEPALSGDILEVRTELSAVIARLPFPLADLLALAEGDLLELPVNAIQSLQIVAADGAIIATGKLGQANGHKAARLLALAGDARGTQVASAMPEIEPLLSASRGVEALAAS